MNNIELKSYGNMKFILKVPPQLFNKAIEISKYKVEIDYTLGEYEWKLIGLIEDEKQSITNKNSL